MPAAPVKVATPAVVVLLALVLEVPDVVAEEALMLRIVVEADDEVALAVVPGVIEVLTLPPLVTGVAADEAAALVLEIDTAGGLILVLDPWAEVGAALDGTAALSEDTPLLDDD